MSKREYQFDFDEYLALVEQDTRAVEAVMTPQRAGDAWTVKGARDEAIAAAVTAKDGWHAVAAQVRWAWIDKHKSEPPQSAWPTPDNVDKWVGNPLTYSTLTQEEKEALEQRWQFRGLCLSCAPGDKFTLVFKTWRAHKTWCEARKTGHKPKHPWREQILLWIDAHAPVIEVIDYPSAILPKWAGDHLEIAPGDVLDGHTLEKTGARDAYYALHGQPRKQTELFEPPEQRLPLLLPPVKLAETSTARRYFGYHGEISQVMRVFHEVCAAGTGPHIDEDDALHGINIKFDLEYFWRALYPDIALQLDAGEKPKFQAFHREKLRAAIEDISRAYVIVNIDGQPTRYRPITQKTFSECLHRLSDPVIFHMEMTWEMNRGGLFVTDTFRQLGYKRQKPPKGLHGKIRGSATKYQFYLALCQYWDAATQNGVLPFPTRPVVARDGDGQILNASGQPLLNARGKPETRWKKGQPILDRHGNAKHEPHPDAKRFYPLVTWQEIQAFIGQRMNECRRILREMQTDGVFTMQVERDGVHFFPSVEHLNAHYARRKERAKHAR